MSRLIYLECFRFDMTTSFQSSTRQASFPFRFIAIACLLAGITGCSTVSDMLEPDKIDYKSATPASKKGGLEVPPDLTQMKGDNRYDIPDSKRGSATASTYNAQRGVNTGSSATPDVAAPVSGKEIRVERAGTQRWLVVKQSPEVLWPRVKEFWQESGFLIASEVPDAGVMETDWAENRAKIPQDIIRNTIGKVLDSLYSTGERDKFRTRLERNADGSTEIFISHRGAQEVFTGQMKERTMWTARASDPELEAEFLGRLMARLGTDQKVAKAALASAKPERPKAQIEKDQAGSFVKIEEGFDRAWRRVGLALDRVGFTVEDRDRSRGLYFVRYVDQANDAQNKSSEPGFFSKWFGSSKDDKKTAVRYRIAVKETGSTTRVSVTDDKGNVTSADNATRILSLLNEQLK